MRGHDDQVGIVTFTESYVRSLSLRLYKTCVLTELKSMSSVFIYGGRMFPNAVAYCLCSTIPRSGRHSVSQFGWNHMFGNSVFFRRHALRKLPVFGDVQTTGATSQTMLIPLLNM